MARETPEAPVLNLVINQVGAPFPSALWTQFISSVGIGSRAGSSRGASLPWLGSSTSLSLKNQLFQSSCSKCPVMSVKPGLRAHLYIKAGLEDSRAGRLKV